MFSTFLDYTEASVSAAALLLGLPEEKKKAAKLMVAPPPSTHQTCWRRRRRRRWPSRLGPSIWYRRCGGNLRPPFAKRRMRRWRRRRKGSPSVPSVPPNSRTAPLIMTTATSKVRYRTILLHTCNLGRTYRTSAPYLPYRTSTVLWTTVVWIWVHTYLSGFLTGCRSNKIGCRHKLWPLLMKCSGRHSCKRILDCNWQIFRLRNLVWNIKKVPPVPYLPYSLFHFRNLLLGWRSLPGMPRVISEKSRATRRRLEHLTMLAQQVMRDREQRRQEKRRQVNTQGQDQNPRNSRLDEFVGQSPYSRTHLAK